MVIVGAHLNAKGTEPKDLEVSCVEERATVSTRS